MDIIRLVSIAGISLTESSTSPSGSPSKYVSFSEAEPLLKSTLFTVVGYNRMRYSGGVMLLADVQFDGAPEARSFRQDDLWKRSYVGKPDDVVLSRMTEHLRQLVASDQLTYH
jgi:hypothetical protein